jgi:hypothetical protein
VRKDGGRPAHGALARVELPRGGGRVLWRRDVRRLVVSISAEISQGALVHVPEVAALASGAELHLRWTPGEGTSLLEVAVCAIDEGTSVPVDLSGMRNVPEASTMGTLSLPRLPVARVQLAVPVPAKGPGVAEIAFDDGERSRVLRLATTGDGPSADVEVRTGSFGGARRRERLGPRLRAAGVGTEEAIARFQAGADQRAGGGRSTRSARPSCSWRAGDGGGASAPETVRAEASIQAMPVELRTVPVLDAVLRERLADGSVALGAPVSAAVLQALRDLAVARARPCASGRGRPPRAGADRGRGGRPVALPRGRGPGRGGHLPDHGGVFRRPAGEGGAASDDGGPCSASAAASRGRVPTGRRPSWPIARRSRSGSRTRTSRRSRTRPSVGSRSRSRRSASRR